MSTTRQRVILIEPLAGASCWRMLLGMAILNLYVGIYDSILVVQIAVLATDIVLRDRRSPISAWLIGCSASPRPRGSAKAWHGFQVYTPALIVFGFFLLRRTKRNDSVCLSNDPIRLGNASFTESEFHAEA